MLLTSRLVIFRAAPGRANSGLEASPRTWKHSLWVASLALAVMTGHLTVGVAVADRSDALSIHRSRATGTARFVTSADGDAMAIPLPPGKRQPGFMDALRAYGHLFGITDADRQLVVGTTETDDLGYAHTTVRQVHEGVPVFAAQLRVHFDAQGGLRAINGTFIPDIKLSVKPVLSADEAGSIALAEVAGQGDHKANLTVIADKLYVFRANLARGVPGPNHLVYELEVGNGADVREFVYVDAHKGHVVDQITGIFNAIDRRIYSGGIGAEFLVWSEGDSLPYGEVDVDHLIDYAQDTYNLVASTSNGAFLSWDGVDGIMHSVNDDPRIPCPNANWNGTSTNFCLGVTGDDTVAHEWGHGYTSSTHRLIYQWQPGALNEAYSDIYGEVVDLINGDGTDSPGDPRTDGSCSVFGGSPPPVCEIHTPLSIAGLYVAGDAAFNPMPPVTATGMVELVNDGDDEGGAGSLTDGCQPPVGFTAGHIALIDRGACYFTVKTLHAQAAGAIAVIVVNNQGDGVSLMGGYDPAITIPSVMIGQSNGDTIRDELPGVNATVALVPATDVSLRWLHGEDDPAFGGPIRDMWNPVCLGCPGKVSDTAQYTCSFSDNGGVHTNCGVPSHGFALLTDGGAYNGQTIEGIGLTKTFHIYWRAQKFYQGPATDFADHADALEQSCLDLIGVDLLALSTETPIGSPSGEIMTTEDCTELAGAIASVELRQEPTYCGFLPMLNPDAPPLCAQPGTVRSIHDQDWEDGIGAWTAGTRDVADPATFDTEDWAVVTSLPDDRAGSAAFVADLIIGDCALDTEAGVLFLESPVISIPTGADVPRIAFDHWVATELTWDGGNVKVSINGGPWELVPATRFDFNPYPLVLTPSDNPMGGEEAFTGSNGGEVSGSWGQSQLNLAGMAMPGDDIRIRFEMGLDGCNGVHGWYVDEVHVYYCSVNLEDYAGFADCLSAPDGTAEPPADCLERFDSDADSDVDLEDFALFQRAFTGQ